MYGGTQGWPNFNSWLQTAWGAGEEYWCNQGAFYGATNLVFGQNPPYYLDDFLSMYPKFFGLPATLTNCTVTSGSSTVTVSSTSGIQFGQFVQAAGILAPGSCVVSIGDGTITVSAPAIATNNNFPLSVFTASPVPASVILMYLRLANASLIQARWCEQWCVAMGWFIAHYCTLYARSDAAEVFEQVQATLHTEAPSGMFPGTVYTLSSQPPGGALQSLTKNGLFQAPGVDYTLSGATVTLTQTTQVGDNIYATWPVQTTVFAPAQLNGAAIAAQGLAGGIQTSKSVGDVSVSYQPLTSLEDWGQWNLTLYGQQLATMAKVMGSGPMVFW